MRCILLGSVEGMRVGDLVEAVQCWGVSAAGLEGAPEVALIACWLPACPRGAAPAPRSAVSYQPGC